MMFPMMNGTRYDSFAIWAKDSFWGAAWEEDETDLFSVSGAGFIAGGRNPTRPTGSGTWRGLAIGTRRKNISYDEPESIDSVLLSEMRVGRSEITVDLDTSKVDVTITGITEGASSTVQVGTTSVTVATLSTLEWMGLPLSDNGYFRDRKIFGEVSTLDDVFGSKLPPEGENFKNTYGTIWGQFYGATGAEVVGLFRKSGYVGSFGAYKD